MQVLIDSDGFGDRHKFSTSTTVVRRNLASPARSVNPNAMGHYGVGGLWGGALIGFCAA